MAKVLLNKKKSSFVIDKQAHTHQHGYHAVYLLGGFPLNRLAVLQPVAVQHGIAEAIGVDWVVVNENMSRLCPMLKTFYRCGEHSVGLPHTLNHVARGKATIKSLRLSRLDS